MLVDRGGYIFSPVGLGSWTADKGFHAIFNDHNCDLWVSINHCWRQEKEEYYETSLLPCASLSLDLAYTVYDKVYVASSPRPLGSLGSLGLHDCFLVVLGLALTTDARLVGRSGIQARLSRITRSRNSIGRRVTAALDQWRGGSVTIIANEAVNSQLKSFQHIGLRFRMNPLSLQIAHGIL